MGISVEEQKRRDEAAAKKKKKKEKKAAVGGEGEAGAAAAAAADRATSQSPDAEVADVAAEEEDGVPVDPAVVSVGGGRVTGRG